MKRSTLLLGLLAAAVAVTVIVGCDELITEVNNITIAGQPTADFTLSNDSGCTPLQVRFKDASSGPVSMWIWYFGDGDSLISLVDTGFIYHTYDSTGNYTVTLTVFDTLDGSDDEVKERAVVAGVTIDSFMISADSGCPGLEVTMRGINFAGVSMWKWYFGDGQIDSGATDSMVTHMYSAADTCEVRLVVRGDCGTTTLLDTVTIVPCAEAYFTVTPDDRCAPCTLTFSDASILPDGQAIVSQQWQIGSTTSTEATVVKIFTDWDTVPVTLTVGVTEGGTSSYSDTIYIIGELQVDTFWAAPRNDCYDALHPFLVKFVAEFEGPIDSVDWNFGDGGTYRDTDVENSRSAPLYHYAIPGIYDVSFTAYGCTRTVGETRNDWIVLSDALNSVDFAVSFVADTVGDTATFTFADSSDGVIIDRTWRFQSAAPAKDTTLTNPSGNTIKLPITDLTSTYKVWLTIRNECDTIFDTLSIAINHL